MKCCIECFSNFEIKEYITTFDEKGDCDYCESKDAYITDIEEVGEFIREGIGRAYEPVDSGTGAFYDPEEELYYPEGSSIEEILKYDIGIFTDDGGLLLGDLISESGPSMRDIKHGDYDWIANDDLVEKDALYGLEGTIESMSWERFKYLCKHFNRYFDICGRKSARAKILSDLNEIFKKMTSILPTGTSLFRARLFTLPKDKALSDLDLLKELSPAPLNLTKNNRMSPIGISYTYLADSVESCLAEIQAQHEDNVIVGKFITRRRLKLLDLSIEPRITVKSIFDPEYNHNDNWLGDFVNSFKGEISTKIHDNDKEMEYVPTQVLAEYIRKMGYHGIKYKSSMFENGYNIALFCSVNSLITPNYFLDYRYLDNEIIPFTDWLNLISAEYINCNLSFEVNDTIKHDDKKAEYRKHKMRYKKKFAGSGIHDPLDF